MESGTKGLQIHAGPIGFIYARARRPLEADKSLALLSAKSADVEDAAIFPLLKGLTVEHNFSTNIASVSGTRTTGLGSCAATAKLLPTHFCPYALAFHGVENFEPSVAAPNLSKLCENARKTFGFSSYTDPNLPEKITECTGIAICDMIGLDPEETVLYLTVTAAFKTAVYLNNTFLHFGGKERVSICSDRAVRINTELLDECAQRFDCDGEDYMDFNWAIRIPLYPLQMAMPDFNRVNIDPFMKQPRALGDGYVMPDPFYNSTLRRLLHSYILGPMAVSLRVREIDHVARGSAHLAFDDAHDGILLPADVTFALLDSEKAADAGENTQNVHSTMPRKQSFDKGHFPAPGIERRTASVMAADAALSLESLISASVYDETADCIEEWPLFNVQTNMDSQTISEMPAVEKDQANAVAAYLTRVAGLVGSMVFSANSALYLNEVGDSGKCDAKELATGTVGSGTSGVTSAGGQLPSYYRFYLMSAPHMASNQLVDRDGKPQRKSSDSENSDKDCNELTKQSTPRVSSQWGKRVSSSHSSGSFQYRNGTTEYKLDYLAMACGFCPQILAKILFYLERCDAGAAAYQYDCDALRYAASAIDSDVPCDLCNKTQKHACVRTTMYRLRQRLPKFGNNSMRGAITVFGVSTNNYNDTDMLGNYAPFSALKRGEGESSRSVIGDTYRVAVERLMMQLENCGLLNREDPINPVGSADNFITDSNSFMHAITAVSTACTSVSSQLLHNLSVVREFKTREGLADANHTVYVTLEPYSSGICPVMSFLRIRSILAILQDMALSQCAHLMHGQQVEARNFRTQFQPVLKKRVLDLQNAGFLTSRPVTVTLADSGVTLPDLTKCQTEPPISECDADLVKVNFDVMRELKIKNRVLFFGGGAASNMSEAARARIAGMAEAYQKSTRRVNVLVGALGFALKRYHAVIFPNGNPGNGKHTDMATSKQPGRAAAAAQWFWSMLQQNQMPNRLLTKNDEKVIRFIRQYTDEYEAMNFVNVQPTCFAELAQFTLTNTILRQCDHRGFYISTITALVPHAKRPKDPAAVITWVGDTVESGADLERRAKSMLAGVSEQGRTHETAEFNYKAWINSFTSTNVVQHIMSTKPLLVMGVNISKYQGVSGSTKVFQAGNWAAIAGGKNVCALMGFDRTKRYVLACPRAGFTCQKVENFPVSANKEKTVSDVAKAILSEGGPTPHVAVFLAVLKAMGNRTRYLDEDDWFSIVEDAYMAQVLCEINRAAEGCPEGWTLDSAANAARETTDIGSTSIENGETTFDFESCCQNTPASYDRLFDLEPSTTDRKQLSHQTIQPAPHSNKRSYSDALFDADPILPSLQDKKPTLTVDML